MCIVQEAELEKKYCYHSSCDFHKVLNFGLQNAAVSDKVTLIFTDSYILEIPHSSGFC